MTDYHWTNHPLIDMGIASLMVFAGREGPGDLTNDDLERYAQYAEQFYLPPKGSNTDLSSYLTVLFTSNFINPSFTPEKKKAFVAETLRLFKSRLDESLPACAYCDAPSVRVTHRDLVPLLTGRETVNFFPGGAPGLALCGKCIVALQALSIGAPMCSGRALIVACDDPALTVRLVKVWQPETRRRVHLSHQSGEKLPIMARPLTRVIEALVKIEAERRDDLISSVTVYHISNSGQGPKADIHSLPSSVVGFIRRATAARYAPAWNEIVRRAWEHVPKPKEGETKPAVKGSLRNYVYEDTFTLPERAARFIRIYFLRRATRYSQGAGDPRATYSGWREAISGLWELTILFLMEVIAMDSGRIDAIRELADALASDVATENDRRLWWKVYSADNYRGVRLTLIQASQRRVKRGVEPVITFDRFLEVFEEGEELPRIDWRLAWDLVLIRVIETLYQTKWFDSNRDALTDEEAEQPKEKEA
jgi:CRISPR-associated protein Cst1